MKGREAIQRIFPGANFLWRACPYAEWLADDWKAFAPRIQSTAAHCANTLPQHLTKLKSLQECTDSALTFLMAGAVLNRAGASRTSPTPAASARTGKWVMRRQGEATRALANA